MDLVWLRQCWLRRQLRHAVASALMGVTPAEGRVYRGRSRPFLGEYATGKVLPAIAVYAPAERMVPSGQAHKSTLSVAVECWVQGRLGVTAGERDEGLEDDLDDLVMCTAQAIVQSPEIAKLLGRLPTLNFDFDIESEPGKQRLAGAGILVEHSYTKTWPVPELAPTANPPRLERAHIEMDVAGPAGTLTDAGTGPDGTPEIVADFDMTEV